MSILDSNPYRDITHVELHEARRRAEAERAAVIRQIFAALLSWRRKAAERRAAAGPTLKTAHRH